LSTERFSSGLIGFKCYRNSVGTGSEPSKCGAHFDKMGETGLIPTPVKNNKEEFEL